MSNKIDISALSQKWIKDSPIYLDTETTGLGGKDEIVQIAIVGDDGRTILDTFVKPTIAIPLDATRIHGITNAMVSGAPAWKDIWQRVRNLMNGQRVIVYNSAYDVQMMRQSCAAHGLSFDEAIDPPFIARFDCCMLLYAEFYGEWNDYRGGYKWQRLEVACQQQGIPTQDIIAHQAAGDCEMTRRLMHKMAAGVEVMA